ncbi:MAG: hypothetical protein WC718_15710 [Phycisphaerales bacterium]
MKAHLPKSASLLLLAAFSGVLAAPATGQTVTVIPGSIRGVSADGQVVVGNYSGSAFTWTPTQGTTRLVDLGVSNIFSAYGISGNGQVVIGSFGGANGARWSQATGLQDFQFVPGYNFGQQAVSGSNDGSIAAGFVTKRVANNFYVSQSVRWGPDGTYSFIGSYNTLGTNRARAISRDGSTIIGTAFDETAAYKWTEAGNIQILPYLLGNQANSSVAAALSGNGQFIVGLSNDRSVIWHDSTVTELRLADGQSGLSSASAVSDDGTVVAGAVRDLVRNDGSYVAGVWTPTTQFIPLTDYLASFGIQVPAGVRLTNVTGISADGRTFVGDTNILSMDFVVTIPAPAGLPILLGSVFLASRRRRA